MIYRRLDKNGDYTFGQGKYNFKKEAEAVSQAIRTKVLLLYGEWWENLEEGTPLFEGIFSQKNTPEGKSAVDMILRERVLDTEGVLRVSSFESTLGQNKTYSVVMSVETVFGKVDEIEIQLGV